MKYLLMFLIAHSIVFSQQNHIEEDTLNSTIHLHEVKLHGDAVLENNKILSANKLHVKPIDLPNSSGVISNRLIEEQQLLTLGEGISAVSGVFQFNKGYGGSSETFGARGVSLRYLGFMFRDGIRFGTNQSLGTPEIQAYERVEILKGGAAINFGNVSPGATINYITKKPLFKNHLDVIFRSGSYAFYKPSIDLNVKLSENDALRVISSAQTAGSFRETVNTQRIYAFGAYRHKFSDDHLLDVNMEFLDDDRPRDFGLPIFENKIIVGYNEKEGRKTPIYLQTEGRERLYSGITKSIRHRFLGSSFNNRNSTQWNGQIKHHIHFNPKWVLTSSAGVSMSKYDYEQTGSGFRNVYIKEGNDIKIIRSLEKANWKENALGAQVNLVGNIQLLHMKNRISLSSDFDLRTQNSDGFPYITNFDYVYLYSRAAKERKSIALAPYLKAKRQFRGYGLTVQNLLDVSPKIKFLASLRLDIVDGYSKNLFLIDGENIVGKIRGRSNFKKGQLDVTKHSATSITPNFGITYKLTENNSLFTSFTNSFNPNTRARLDINDNVLPPYKTNQFELGTKNIFGQGKYQFNLSLFKIDDNSYLTHPSEEDRYVIGPGTKYKGAELDLFSTFDNVNWNVNYTYIDAKYGDGGSRVGGTRPQQTPAHQIGFRVSYQFNQGGWWNKLSMNLNGQYTSERLGNDYFKRNSQSPYLQKAYTLVNVGAQYNFDKLSLSLRATNLLDEFVFFSYRTGSVNPIDPFQIALVTKYTF